MNISDYIRERDDLKLRIEELSIAFNANGERDFNKGDVIKWGGKYGDYSGVVLGWRFSDDCDMWIYRVNRTDQKSSKDQNLYHVFDDWIIRD